ncbi:hypothetical protein OPQ81_002765 [Rhizoctonia solani]|nr:hypothetical protein OPQ81_002765 [Rhizoctonia solani]
MSTIIAGTDKVGKGAASGMSVVRKVRRAAAANGAATRVISATESTRMTMITTSVATKTIDTTTNWSETVQTFRFLTHLLDF